MEETVEQYEPRHAAEPADVEGIEPPERGTAHETIPAWQGVIKAIVGALVAFLGALGTALSDGRGFADLTAFQWVTATTAALVALGGVYALPNRDPKAGPQG